VPSEKTVEFEWLLVHNSILLRTRRTPTGGGMAGKKKEKKEKKEKPLDRWTVKELREEALQIPNLQGVHGMNKDELLAVVREAKGLSEPPKKSKAKSVRDTKKKVVELKKIRDDERSEGAARSRMRILRRKISRLKKQTRR
jgi:hypothetical protein